nr:MAG TPA: tail completion protein [Caudoviricetes sp.]
MIQKIIKTLTQILVNKFKNIDVNSTNINAGYKLPCFFIEVNSVKTEKLSYKIDTLYINLDILYACTDKKENQKECFEISEKLRVLLLEKPIKVNDDISFQIYEDSIDIGEDYVSMSFDIEMNLIKDIEEDLSYMENVIVK